MHDPAKVVTELALSLVPGGYALCDAALLRAQPGLYGLVGSAATISTLAGDADKSLKAMASSVGRHGPGCLAGASVGRGRKTFPRSPGVRGHLIVVDLDATLITEYSDKESAETTLKKGYGHHPLCAFEDHGPEGTGEPLALRLRLGRAGSNTAADHVGVTRDALDQLPEGDPSPPGERLLTRADGAGGSRTPMSVRVRTTCNLRIHASTSGSTSIAMTL